MNETRHLTDSELVRTLDGELTVIERAEIDEHLIRCESCLERYEALADFSSEIETAINGTAVRPPRDARERLIAALESSAAANTPHPRGTMRVWWWAAAAAAAAVIVFLTFYRPQLTTKEQLAITQEQPSATPAPVQVEDSDLGHLRTSRHAPRPALQTPDKLTTARSKGTRTPKSRAASAAQASTSEFMRLPYADAALPVQAAGLVRVRMQLSMLAHAGVIQMSPGAPDAPVEADLLLGIDGQPYAVRLVSAHQ
jgi:hypothetical protein